MKPIRNLRWVMVVLAAACFIGQRALAHAQDNSEPPKTTEKKPEEPGKKLNPAGYKHRVRAKIGVDDAFTDLSGVTGSCDLTVHVQDQGGIDGDKVASRIAVTVKSSSPHYGISDNQDVAEDQTCHKENDFDAWPTKISCTFGVKTVEMVLDPNEVPGAKPPKVKKQPSDQWLEPEKAKSEPSVEETYVDAQGKKHTAPKRTVKTQQYKGKGSITGGVGGGQSGGITITVALEKSGRACGNDEPGAVAH